MLVFGLVGGIASGKSAVARLFVELGAGLLDGDAAGHEVLRFPEVRDAARKQWGDGVFASDGQIDRRSLAQIVFGDSPESRRELACLQAFTHPKIRELLRSQAGSFEKEGKKLAVLDAPVMLETGWNDFCDKIIFVDAPHETRLARALARGWSREQFAARERNQWPTDRKRGAADFVIENGGDLAATRAQVETIWRNVVA